MALAADRILTANARFARCIYTARRCLGLAAVHGRASALHFAALNSVRHAQVVPPGGAAERVDSADAALTGGVHTASPLVDITAWSAGTAALAVAGIQRDLCTGSVPHRAATD